MITRRTVRRTHLLRPDRALNQMFTYCIAVLARKHGILVHAAVVMSTHEHLIVTDTEGRLPRFIQELHRMVALCVKVLRRWDGAVWDHRKTSVVELCTPQAICEKIAYVMANPVAAGLIRHAHEWRGVTTTPRQLGAHSWTATKPSYFFGPGSSTWPPSATLALTLPPALAMEAHELRESVALELTRLEAAAHAEWRTRGWRPPARRALAARSPYARATSKEPVQDRNPAFAVGREQHAARRHAAATLHAFRAAHRVALEQWRSGLRSVLFPCGTWLMRVIHGALCAP